MAQNTSSDSSKPETICEGLIGELLDALDEARNLDDLYTSLKAQHKIIEAILILVAE